MTELAEVVLIASVVEDEFIDVFTAFEALNALLLHLCAVHTERCVQPCETQAVWVDSLATGIY